MYFPTWLVPEFLSSIIHLKYLLNLVLVLSMLRACVARLAFQREDKDSVLSLETAVYPSTATDNNSTTQLAYTAN